MRSDYSPLPRKSGRFVTACAVLCAVATAPVLLNETWKASFFGGGGDDDSDAGSGHTITTTLPCSSVRGGPDGRWERDPLTLSEQLYSDSYGHDPANPPQAAYRKAMTYAWRDPPEVERQCGGRVMPLTAATFCSATERLGIGRVMLVGDSMGYSQYVSLVRQIGLDIEDDGGGRPTPQESLMDCGGTMSGSTTPQTTLHYHSVEVVFVMNGQLWYPNKGNGIFGDWITAYKEWPKTTSASSSSSSAGGRTLLLADVGLHLANPMRKARHAHGDTIDWFLRTVATEGVGRPADLVFLRTNAGGHSTCQTATEPFATQEEYKRTLLPENMPPEVADTFKPYGWEKQAGYNEYVREAVKRYNSDNGNADASTETTGRRPPNKPSVQVLDVEYMLNLRPDGHTSSPGNPSPKKLDCLHYLEPGPMDWLNNLLFANLADLPSVEYRESKGAGEMLRASRGLQI